MEHPVRRFSIYKLANLYNARYWSKVSETLISNWTEYLLELWRHLIYWITSGCSLGSVPINNFYRFLLPETLELSTVSLKYI